VIDAARRARIRHLFYVEHWQIRMISALLGIHRNAVYHAIETAPFVARRRHSRAPLDGIEASHDLRQCAPLEVAP
jgi:hypothetical protein